MEIDKNRIEEIEKDLMENYNPVPPSELLVDFEPDEIKEKKDRVHQYVPTGILINANKEELDSINDFIRNNTKARVFYIHTFPPFESIYLLSLSDLKELKHQREVEAEKREEIRISVEEKGRNPQ